jgi:hypothetical protein
MGDEVLRPRGPRGTTVVSDVARPPVRRTRTTGADRPLQIPGTAGIIGAIESIGIRTLCIDDRRAAL